MANIANFVEVSISIQDLAPSIPNFGTILILAASAIPQDQVYVYDANPDGLAAYVADGGATTDPGYKALAAIAGMSPHVPTVKFFSRGAAATTDTYTLLPINVIEGRTYSVTINGTEVSYTAVALDTATEVGAALEPLIEAIDGVSSTVSSGTITITATGQEDVYFEGVDPFLFTFNETTADSGADTDLTAAAALDNDFYGVWIDSHGDADIADVAAYCEANKKIFLAQTFDVTSLAGNGVLETLYDAGYHRTGLLVAGDYDTPPSAALMGREFATDPGASSFAFKNLPGVTVDALSATHVNNVKGKNGITYTRTSGVSFTSSGKAVSGRQLHVTRNIDWLQARIEQGILTEFVNSEIVEMSDKGIAQMEKSLRSTLSEAERMHVILPGWTVTAPKKADLASADVNAGILRGLKFQAEAAKAAEKVIISGTIF